MSYDIFVVYDDQIWTARANVDKYNDSNAHGAMQICHGHGTSYINRASVSDLSANSQEISAEELMDCKSGDWRDLGILVLQHLYQNTRNRVQPHSRGSPVLIIRVSLSYQCQAFLQMLRQVCYSLTSADFQVRDFAD